MLKNDSDQVAQKCPDARPLEILRNEAYFWAYAAKRKDEGNAALRLCSGP